MGLAWATPERAIAAAIIAARAVNNTMRFILAPPLIKGGVISPAVSANATTLASIGYPAHHANE
jgi:hypothetical protein